MKQTVTLKCNIQQKLFLRNVGDIKKFQKKNSLLADLYYKDVLKSFD